MNTEPIFSIIIPHYNIPKLLRRCLDSIPPRDDLEIIVVDDCSNPEIVDFDNFPGQERPDVRIIFSKQNGGGGYARNLGLDVAKGKWILFADADDYFTYCLNEMLDKYRESDADIVFFDVIAIDSEYYTIANRGQNLNSIIKLADSNRRRAETKLRYAFGEPWCKLIKRQLIEIHNIHFDRIPVHNDTTFSYLVGHYAQRIEIDKHAFYVLTFRECSVSSLQTANKQFVRIDVFARREKFLKDNDILLDNDCFRNYHYNPICDMLIRREWQSVRTGVAIILHYNPSRGKVYLRVLWLVTGKLIKNLRRRSLRFVSQYGIK